MTNSIKKKSLWKYVNKKIKVAINAKHVLAIISILFDEMLIDLKAGKEIPIYNFGSFLIKKMPAKRYHDFRFKETRMSPGYKVMRFFLRKKVAKFITNNLDLDTVKKSG